MAEATRGGGVIHRRGASAAAPPAIDGAVARVNLDQVAQFTPSEGGRFELEMTDGTKLPVSRSYAKVIREKAV